MLSFITLCYGIESCGNSSTFIIIIIIIMERI